MVRSMTGYGKAEQLAGQNKIVVEIRSVNGKNADISLKTQIIPREKEMEVRQLISKELYRGNIDLFATIEYAQESGNRVINRDIFCSYLNQIKEINKSLAEPLSENTLLNTIIKLPDVIEVQKKESDEELWMDINICIQNALEQINQFRLAEGKKLEEDIRARVSLILRYVSEVEKYESERVDSIKTRLISRLEELSTIQTDNNRLEQELIYYLEKFDITEEKVRLRQHCKYFEETLNNEENPGKKIGFIAQEMGREINTMGSKANHAQIQQWVVKMKDELEKIKEQSLNIL